jgi:(p)ppGpp synthase/HD superfamily hydrolase
MYTYKIEQAIKAAALLHHEQLRKGVDELPFVTHLMSVVLILRDYTQDEDTLVAALLHDTVEDTDYTLEELSEDFGENVHKIVVALTEPRGEDAAKMSWGGIKKCYAKQIKNGPIEAVMVSAADKIHNFRSMVEEYHDDHDGFLRNFGTNLDERLAAYQTIANAINNRLTGGIVNEFNHTFEQYKNFIFDVKESIN